MRKVFDFTYAGLAYVLAMANIAYIVGFLSGFGVPKAIDSGSYEGSLLNAVFVNTVLVLGFGLHHSVTARPWFKARWTKLVPAHLERATYLYMTAVVTAVLVLGWQPIPITLWKLEQSWAIAAMVGAYLLVWSMMFAATFHFGHFGFFGLAQVWEKFRGSKLEEGGFSARYLYGLMRHPISLGWMLTPWLVPHLTLGHVVFALSAAAYVLTATYFEEQDLIAEFGERYRQYRQDVPAFLPRIRRTRGATGSSEPINSPARGAQTGS